MSCLTSQQLALLALENQEGSADLAHLEQCDLCRAKLAQLRTAGRTIAAAHAAAVAAQSASREMLIAALEKVDTARLPGRASPRWRFALPRLTPAQRVTGSLGATAVIVILLLMVFVADSATSLSAMERMVRQLQDVKSYRYKLFTRDTFRQDGETSPTTIVHTGTTYWRDPASLYYDEEIVRTAGPALAREKEGGVCARFTGIHPGARPGLLIYHAGRTNPMERTFRWVPEIDPDYVWNESPIEKLRMVREGEGKVIRELGTKLIGGKQARGFVMALANAEPGSGFDALDVWVDPETDLPMEFGYQVKTDDSTRVFRLSDCRWNIEIDPKLFDTTPPAGYDDITVPGDEKALDEIVTALQLYAELSGGHYPPAQQSNFHSDFHSDAIRNELMQLAGYTGPPQAKWNRDEKYQRIQQAAVGFDWIERILRNGVNAGYYGDTVGPEDKDNILLWWNIPTNAETYEDQQFRVFYGDLRTDVLPLAKWAALVPSEVAEYHLPHQE